MLKKLPPPEKIYEALGAIADGRVSLAPQSTKESGQALAQSSNGEKSYEIAWRDGVFSSKDNASFWQGYPGYPVIAVLMLLGLLPYDKDEADLFSGINWNEENKKAGRDYVKALANVFLKLGLDAEKQAQLQALAQKTLQDLAALEISLKRPKKAGSKAGRA